jgi:hypothetical protein
MALGRAGMMEDAGQGNNAVEDYAGAVRKIYQAQQFGSELSKAYR